MAVPLHGDSRGRSAPIETSYKFVHLAWAWDWFVPSGRTLFLLCRLWQCLSLRSVKPAIPLSDFPEQRRVLPIHLMENSPVMIVTQKFRVSRTPRS